MYNIQQNVWKTIEWKLPFGIEAAPFYYVDPTQILVMGGRIH